MHVMPIIILLFYDINMVIFDVMKVGRGHTRFLGGLPKREACFDLIIGDMPDGLHVPGVGLPRPVVSSWNVLIEDWSEPIFEVARNHLQDNGVVLLFHPDISTVRDEADVVAEAYNFKYMHDWWGVNELLLTTYKDSNRTVSFLFTVIEFDFSEYVLFQFKSAKLNKSIRQSASGSYCTSRTLTWRSP